MERGDWDYDVFDPPHPWGGVNSPAGGKEERSAYFCVKGGRTVYWGPQEGGSGTDYLFGKISHRRFVPKGRTGE